MEELLGIAAARTRPLTTAGTRRLEVTGAIGGLFPGGGIQRGSTVGVGAVSLSLGLAGAVMAGGSWAAAVGFPSLGIVAAAEMGVPLERFGLVPAPGERWPAVVAALLDGVDLLLLCPPAAARAADARRLAARAREKGTVLVVVEGAGKWPESPDIRIEVESAGWSGIGAGHGRLRRRKVEVVVSGRRVAGGRPSRVQLWLPGRGGSVEAVEAVEPVALSAVV